jgi:hypothetical protein
MPLELIDKRDNFEKVRDEIAAILAFETANQQDLAVLAGKNPELWKFDVYIERARIWESLSVLEEPVSPVVSVYFESENFAGDQSYNALLQTADPGIFNIEIFTTTINQKNIGDGYITADRAAILDCQRVIRLIRNILFSVPADSSQPGQDYTYLNMRGVVAHRRIQSVVQFQPDYKKQAVILAAARIALGVKYIETALEGPDQPFELLQVQATTTAGGQVIIQFDQT